MKLLLREEDWERARELWEDAGTLVTARTTYIEARSALARAHRAARLSARMLARAQAELDERWQRIDIVELDQELALAAGQAAEQFQLRAFDALHLAAARTLADPELVVATWDDKLGIAALEAGLAVAP